MWLNKPPVKDYYAVIFSSNKSETLEGYKEMDDAMMALAQQQEGFLGYESVANGTVGIFISYWQNLESIDKWRKNNEHGKAKAHATNWYARYLSQICKEEQSHLFEKETL